MPKTPSIEQAKRTWSTASNTHVGSTAAVHLAQEALDRLRGLIAQETAKLDMARSEQRATILKTFGLGTEAPEQVSNVLEVQARLDALESVLPEHEAKLERALAAHATSDTAVKEAERAILEAKAAVAVEEEAKAFAAFQKAHLHYLAIGLALNRADMMAKLGPAYWTTRLYGDRHHIDYTVPGVEAARDELLDLAEQGK